MKGAETKRDSKIQIKVLYGHETKEKEEQSEAEAKHHAT
jgi:hypothetical protein